MARRRKTKGGAESWSAWFQENNPLATKPALAPVMSQGPTSPLPTPVQGAVQDSQQMAMTAGRRLKKHFGYDPASGKSMRKLLRTAKGDRMLGRRKRRTHRR
jgi:hypothetical protein